MKFSLESIVNTCKTAIIIVLIVFLEYKTNNVVLNVQNSNLNKQLDLNTFAVLDIASAGFSNPEIVEVNTDNEVAKTDNTVLNNSQFIEEKVQPIASYSGKMTGYVYNCPKCSGKLACDSSLDLSNANINYFDNTYGNIRIVASSKNLECGSIVSINSKLSTEPIIAIVLDRGVSGTKLDLLVESEETARTQVGNTSITYDLLRKGY